MGKFETTQFYCKCGQAIEVTHFTGHYLLTCKSCGRNHWEGWRGLLGRLFGGGFYCFLCTGRWPRYVKDLAACGAPSRLSSMTMFPQDVSSTMVGGVAIIAGGSGG